MKPIKQNSFQHDDSGVQINDLLQWYTVVLGSLGFCVTSSHTSSINLHSPTQLTPWPWTSLASTSPVVQRHVFASSCPVNPNRTRWHQSKCQQVRLQTVHETLMLFAPHGTLSPLSDLFAAPGAMFWSNVSIKTQNRWELFTQKNSAVLPHMRPPRPMRYHEIPSFIKPFDQTQNHPVDPWKPC